MEHDHGDGGARDAAARRGGAADAALVRRGPCRDREIALAALSLRALRKSYGGVAVIHGVSCEIADGEMIVVVGPSGCGKSTLLRMVAGLEEVTEGEIAIGGRVVNREIGRASCRERV